MRLPGRRLSRCLALGMLVALWQSAVWGQFANGTTTRFDLSASVGLPEADGSVRTHLERVRALTANGQWEEAVEVLRQVMQSADGRMIEFRRDYFLEDARLWLNLRDYCHAQLSMMPPEGLALYRNRVDPQAEVWLKEGLQHRDRDRLRRIVREHYCSSSGDDALWALGEMELADGDPSGARAFWEQLIEQPPRFVPADLVQRLQPFLAEHPADEALLKRFYVSDDLWKQPLWRLQEPDGQPLDDEDRTALVELWRRLGFPAGRLAYPGTTIPPAEIRARLILCSIFEDSLDRAAHELAQFKRWHGAETGRLAGKEGNLAASLSEQLAAAQQWSAGNRSQEWLTFGSSSSRNQHLRGPLEIGAVQWRVPLEKVTMLDASAAVNLGLKPRRVAEDNNALLSYHPVVAGNLVLVSNQSQIFAFDLRTGTPAWPTAADRPPGEIYVNKQDLGDRHQRFNTLGVPRYTLTVHNNRLYARMGQPVTSVSPESPPRSALASLVCLDLNAQGRLLRTITPEDDRWAFEGAPVCDGVHLFVAMRKSDVRPQAHVACYDVQDGRLKWRQFVCSADTPAQGVQDECTHNLLTLHRQTLYLNTNLGGVAALDARDGRIEWFYAYPRARTGDMSQPPDYLYRDLTPALYDRGRLFVAPADCSGLLMLDAATGTLLGNGPFAQDAVHLLGVVDDRLIVSGVKLRMLDTRRQNKLLFEFPQGMNSQPKGYGRGVVVDHHVYWPTHDQIFVFDARNGQRVGQPIDLRIRNAMGGNLIVAGDMLLIASHSELIALSPYSQVRPDEKKPDMTFKGARTNAAPGVVGQGTLPLQTAKEAR